ncbi:hypothetical protein D0Z07_4769 [Hyphodiscus hymeniophilus]|uniref:Uncharacterized protein n=1 Tax=Hyphodiscus hymeniophilus TaxID=353542 RepID=A0A9P6VIJ2_9HELO|nr:hypothetical protein D0Z07_4769 [Hyphodiscus hymeniophilus]
MSLPTFTEAMQGFTINGLSDAEALKKRAANWNWKLGAELVGPYLDGNDLAACCLVSRDLHKCFMPILWSKPFLILETNNKPFLKMSMMISRARGASLEVRSLVREFDLGRFFREKIGSYDMHPIAGHDGTIYDDNWFIVYTRIFPNLQSAILDQAPHAYRSAVGKFLANSTIHNPAELERFMVAANKVTSRSTASIGRERNDFASKIRPILFSAHGSLESKRLTLLSGVNTSNLMYLDLSYTKRDSSSVFVLPSLPIGYPNLRILKLRGLRMVDAEFARLTQIHGCKLWSLDVTDNLLTDLTVAELISDRFMLSKLVARKNFNPLPDQDLFEDVPDYQRIDGERVGRTPFRPDDSNKFIKYIEKHSTFPPIHEQILDDQDPFLRHTGLTHLYISSNRLSSEGVALILRNANRLQVLDVGYAESYLQAPAYVPARTNFGRLGTYLAPDLSRESRSQMEVLRIQHALVTYTPTITHEGANDHRFTLGMVIAAETCGSSTVYPVRMKFLSKAFSPLDNYRLIKLTLTDIPTKSSGFTLDRLIDFLEDCRIQEEILNAAREHAPRSRRAPQLLPGLRTLCLEFLPEDTNPQVPDAGSVSGDRDAANFQAYSEEDFSFFEDRNTMSSVSRRGSVATLPVSSSNPPTPTGRKGSFLGGVC